MHFLTYGIRKTSSDKCFKSPVWEDPSTSNMENGPNHCWNLNDSTFIIFIYPIWRPFRLKKSLWVIWKILILFFNALTADDKYSFLNTGNLLQHFQMQLSQKWKIFCQFFLHFRNFDSFLTTFNKKMTLIADAFFNLRNPKNVFR